MDLSQWSEKLKESSSLTRSLACRILARVREIRESITHWPEPTDRKVKSKSASTKKSSTKPKKTSSRKSAKGRRTKRS